MTNKKIIIAIAAVLVIGIGAGVYIYAGKDKIETPTNQLPVVTENDIPAANVIVDTPEIDYSQIDLPKSDNEGLDNLITEEIPAMTEDEIEAALAAEEGKDNPSSVMTAEEIEEQNRKIIEAKKEAEANSNTQPVISQPAATPEPDDMPPPLPPKDADGFRYTKEEAVKNFTTAFQKIIDTNDLSYTDALESAKKKSNFTQEAFDADVHQLLTDPYSSPIMASSLNEYRRAGLLDGVIFRATVWLANGGDDGPWVETVVQ